MMHKSSAISQNGFERRFSLPNISILVDDTIEHSMYSFIDDFNGYNQIVIDIEKTVFRTSMNNFIILFMSSYKAAVLYRSNFYI